MSTAPTTTGGDPREVAAAWPIGAALLQAPTATRDGTPAQDAGPGFWRRVFREVRLAGFDHVDLTDSWLRPADLSADRLSAFADVLADEGLGVTAITTARRSPIDPDPDVARDNVDYLRRTLDTAARLGTTTVSMGLMPPLSPAQADAEWFWLAPSRPDPADGSAFAAAAEVFTDLGHHAADLGLQVSLEMYEETYLGSADSAVRLVTEIGLDNVGLNPDVANLIRHHRPVEPAPVQFAKTLPHANYWHVKNYYRDHDPATGSYATAPAPLEFGVINYRRAFETALAAGFTGPICCEHYGGDGLSVSARNRDFVREVIGGTLELLALPD